MWYTFFVMNDLGQVTQYHWPWGRPDIVGAGTNMPDPASNSGWGVFTLGSSGLGCGGDVALVPAEIGTTNQPSSSQIKFTTPPLPNTLVNTFYARPSNIRPVGSADILSNQLNARFYIANWGSLPDWNDLGPGGNISTLWREITPVPPPENIGPIAAGFTAGPSSEIHFDWALDDCERYDYIADAYPPQCPGRTKRRPHQCMLVEVSSATQLTFRNRSVYRNMDFVPVSTFIREAEISVAGLAPIPMIGPRRDVYLYVETRNMPARTGARTSLEPAAGTRLQRGLPGAVSKLYARDSAERTPPTFEAIDWVMPTYRVHVYRATGDSIIIQGTRRPILHAQTSFGYWASHLGDIAGWRHRLTGASLVELAPAFYKLAVPQGGSATVTTTIEALEPKRFAFSLHGGLSLPHGSFKSAYKNGFGITANLEHRLSNTFSLAALLGYHRFDSVATSAHLDVYHASASLETFLTSGATAVFIEAGGGAYRFNPGSTKPGAHAGVGVEFELSPPVVLGASYRAHTVFTTGSNTTFSSVQAGVRFRF